MTGALVLRFLPLWIPLALMFTYGCSPKGAVDWAVLVWGGSLVACVAAAYARQTDIAAMIMALLTGLATSAALLVLVTAFAPAYQCYTPRGKVSELTLALSGFKTGIAEHVERTRSLRDAGLGLAMRKGGQLQYGLIGTDGELAAFNVDLGAAVAILPSLQADGAVAWTCVGVPSSLMPRECRHARTR